MLPASGFTCQKAHVYFMHVYPCFVDVTITVERYKGEDFSSHLDFTAHLKSSMRERPFGIYRCYTVHWQ